ncbi:MAG: Trm112 family protein [Ghiorsea sp.]|nr:Trm112 family protein [Ghiorsea sp.]
MIDKDLFAILVCPKCKNKIEYNQDKLGLVCKSCQLEYPIRDDIPVMLVDEAKPLAD